MNEFHVANNLLGFSVGSTGASVRSSGTSLTSADPLAGTRKVTASRSPMQGWILGPAPLVTVDQSDLMPTSIPISKWIELGSSMAGGDSSMMLDA